MAGLPCTVYFKWYKEANEVNTTSSLQGDEMVDLVTDLIKGVVDCDFTFLMLVSVQCSCLSINNICKVTALKVQCKQRYRLLKFWQFNAYKNGW